MKKYLKIWWILSRNYAQQALVTRLSASVLLVSKFLRFGFFLFFLLIIGTKTHMIGGYTLLQMIFFYLTYVLLDTMPQLFMREVYRFRSYIVSGDFDFFLVKPLSPLWRSLFGGTDILDIPLTLATILAIILTIPSVGHVTGSSIFIYIVLIINAFIISISFHILVISLGVMTTEVDNAIMLYRDLTQMGTIPVDIYQGAIRSFLTFAIPIGIMMTFPAKALMGLLSGPLIVISFLVGVFLLFISLQIWKFALKHYASASS